jgi:hypothetical protein
MARPTLDPRGLRRRLGGLAAACACALLAAGTAGAAGAGKGLADATIAGLKAEVEDGELLVSFNLDNGFPKEVRERLHAGNAISYRHRVDMILRKSFWLTPNKLLGRTVVETKVEYDELTRQYKLYRRTENKTKVKDDPFLDLEVRRTTESLDEAVDWMTVVEEVPLPWRPDLSGSDRLRVKVHSNLGRRFVLQVFPSSYSVTAELRLEF